MTLNENCTHCGSTVGLIADDWGVWHCLDRDGCASRRLTIGELRKKVRELEVQLEMAEMVGGVLAAQVLTLTRKNKTLEAVGDEAVKAMAETARVCELHKVADDLEAAWYRHARPSPRPSPLTAVDDQP